MTPVLFGVALGALLPIACASVDRFLRLRKQRRLAMRYLHRTMPVTPTVGGVPTVVTFAPTFIAPRDPASIAAWERYLRDTYESARRRRKPPANEP